MPARSARVLLARTPVADDDTVTVDEGLVLRALAGCRLQLFRLEDSGYRRYMSNAPELPGEAGPYLDSAIPTSSR
ncbi:hypothetical protein JK364_42850 [Streptomyces sp. 110]|uniref:Uncharacterized protein n=1 Tax=Streptomyces endocoffeicus TaxID=2898945 RepID=A0ABS1Q314_9ACTN|nr:hypothetical protein [Streptomyces endocoffeicus]MBL1119057.1 hypothetical protein [Streptomyces endocoffeicus]